MWRLFEGPTVRRIQRSTPQEVSFQNILFDRQISWTNIYFTDCRRGQSLVVWAITEGRQAARQIDGDIMGAPSLLPGPGGVILPNEKQ